MDIKPGLTENEFNKIAGQLKRRVQLNNAMMGKVKKLATFDQVTKLLAIENEFGVAIPKCPAYNLWHKLKSNGTIK